MFHFVIRHKLLELHDAKSSTLKYCAPDDFNPVSIAPVLTIQVGWVSVGIFRRSLRFLGIPRRELGNPIKERFAFSDESRLTVAR